VGDIDDRNNPPSVNPGYAHLQLAKALVSAAESGEPDVRARSQERVEKWARVFANIVQGTVAYGSRKPLADVPTWATPEVVTGGFVTGTLLAGGALRPHETDLLRTITTNVASDPRKTLNLHFLCDAGLSTLKDKLASGCYEIEIPEEGALLVVTWLLAKGHADVARSVLDEIGGHFSQLRFYPRPAATDVSVGSDVFLRDVETVIKGLKQRRPNERINRQKQAVAIWAPLYDEMVSLMLQSFDGTAPALAGVGSLAGGTPFKIVDAKWQAEAQRLLERIDSAGVAYPGCKKPHDRKHSFAQLRHLIERAVSGQLSESETRRAAELVARYVTKRGVPGSEKHRSLRSVQLAQSSAPTFLDLTTVAIDRLSRYPLKGGISRVEPIVRPIQASESTNSVPPESIIPPTIAAKVRRCTVDSIANLVAAGVIPSADTLAEVLPQVTSGLRSLGIRDPQLRRLYSSLYRAFRHRRSLLLLNLESQVRMEELPWIAAIEQFREQDLAASEIAKQALIDLVLLTVTSFPHAIVPNKVLQELRSLAKGAQLELPLVDELAADIFMGQFSGKFVRAAKVAADLLDGTVYAKYFAIDCNAIRQLPEEVAQRRWLFSRQKSDAFLELICARAGVRPSSRDVAINGMLIEQQQILTTQNLAVLVNALGLRDSIAPSAGELAKKCFVWICRRLQANGTKTHDHLIAIKNSAYAWRQAIFFLSLTEIAEAEAFAGWAREHLDKQSRELQERLGPALTGLRWSLQNGVAPPRTPGENGTQFLGWANHRHWLLPKKAPQT
jgi:hypothetical protein